MSLLGLGCLRDGLDGLNQKMDVAGLWMALDAGWMLLEAGLGRLLGWMQLVLLNWNCWSWDGKHGLCPAAKPIALSSTRVLAISTVSTTHSHARNKTDANWLYCIPSA